MTTNPGHVVGRGPVATVHLGRHAGRPVALKVFPHPFDRRTAAAFERERAALRGVPSLLPVDGVDRLPDGRQVLRMELCARSLATLVRQSGPLPAADVIALGRALATALAGAHAAGVVHGGLTPTNVLFRPSSEPLLADAAPSLRHAYRPDPLHAVEFRSPQAVRADTRAESDDLYALGAVLHFALTGAPPHAGGLGEPPGDRVLRVLRDPVPPITRPGVPAELSTLVARLLSADPTDRPRDAAARLTRMATGAAPAPTAGTRLVSFDYRGATARPRRLLRLAATGTALLAASAVTLALRPGEDMSTTPAAPPPTTRTTTTALTAVLELADPELVGDAVELTWRSTVPMDYVVIVTTEGGPLRSYPAGRTPSIRIPVDPGRAYCFRVRASTPTSTHESRPKPLRGAACGTL